MCNNTTACYYYPNISINHSLSSYIVITWSASITVAVLSPVAVVGNALVLAAIWRNASLRTPSYLLLAGLAFTDLSTGLISQPFYAAMEFIKLSGIRYNRTVAAIATGSATYFIPITTSIISLMSIERWLHMTRRSLFTVRRVYCTLAVLYLIMVPFPICRELSIFHDKPGLEIATMLYILACLIVTSIANAKVFRIIRSHQKQIQSNYLSRPSAKPAINIAKYKKSVYTVLYILAIFYVSYTPIVIPIGLSVILASDYDNLKKSLSDLAIMFMFLSSSLNPFLYLWRMNDIRNEVTTLVKTIFRKDN